MRRWLLLVLWLASAMLLGGCGSSRLDGANLLQSRLISFEQEETRVALQRLRALGANAVAIVVFLSQDRRDATAIEHSAAVTEAQMVAAIRTAKSLGFRVVLKPQMLVRDSWAGAIEPQGEVGWRAWFAAYGRHLTELARLGQAEAVDVLVIGTELRRADSRPEWAALIKGLRAEFHGELTYAAHGLDGFESFAHWNLLDSAAITLYPALGADTSRAAMRRRIDEVLAALRRTAAALGKPLLIAEVGIQSRRGAQATPWEWRHPDPEAPADQGLQADVIDLWLDALRGNWNRGVLLWAWSNDPLAGGPEDRDYLLQNKSAEGVIYCHWSGGCRTALVR